MPSAINEKQPKRHCWECVRRRLVCDFTRPACRRCSASGVACPGYDAVKPLNWVGNNRSTVKKKKRSTGSEHGGIVLRADKMGIPSLQLKCELGVVFEAAEYYNACIYPDVAPICDLAPNPNIYRLSPSHLKLVSQRPEHVSLMFVCMVLNYQINRVRDDPDCRALGVKLYRYREIAIRSLRVDLNTANERNRDILLSSVIAFLLADAQQDASWQWHLEGARNLINARGGIRALAQSPGLEQVANSFLLSAVLGNTTCPVSQLGMTSSHLDDIDFITDMLSQSTFSVQMCPPALFGEIIRINHLRLQTATDLADESILEAYSILSRIDSFSASNWADTKPLCREDWTLIGNAYKAAVALYCISSLSLQNIPTLPSTNTATRSQDLHKLLCQTLLSPRIHRYITWPLVVLGFDAVHRTPTRREWVRRQLADMSRRVGTSVPLTARNVLERFWKSGETSWDMCFPKPYAFVSLMALNTKTIRT